jgi:hypothetical protein
MIPQSIHPVKSKENQKEEGVHLPNLGERHRARQARCRTRFQTAPRHCVAAGERLLATTVAFPLRLPQACLTLPVNGDSAVI